MIREPLFLLFMTSPSKVHSYFGGGSPSPEQDRVKSSPIFARELVGFFLKRGGAAAGNSLQNYTKK